MALSVTYTNFCGRIVAENRSGTQSSYLRDTLGSTAALVNDTLAITDSWGYWPFGEVSLRTGSNATPFSLVGTLGYYWSTLLAYVRARWYTASLCSWLSVDKRWPVESAYVYADQFPVSRVDPSGLTALFPYGTNTIASGGGSGFGSLLERLFTYLSNCAVCTGLIGVILAAFPCIRTWLKEGTMSPATCAACCNAFFTGLGGVIGAFFNPFLGALIGGIIGSVIGSVACDSLCPPCSD